MLSPEILSDFQQSPVLLSGFQAFRLSGCGMDFFFFPIYLSGFVDSHQGQSRRYLGTAHNYLNGSCKGDRPKLLSAVAGEMQTEVWVVLAGHLGGGVALTRAAGGRRGCLYEGLQRLGETRLQLT